MTVVFDTSVLIDILRNDPGAVEYAKSVHEVPTCSEMTRVEVVRGLRSSERSGAEQLLGSMRWIVVDEAIARRAGELGRRWDRHRPGISLADLVIAATAEQVGGELVTTNVRHFPMFEDLQPPYAAS
jgi:predicted nucleic acid-binding protein